MPESVEQRSCLLIVTTVVSEVKYVEEINIESSTHATSNRSSWEFTLVKIILMIALTIFRITSIVAQDPSVTY